MARVQPRLPLAAAEHGHLAGGEHLPRLDIGREGKTVFAGETSVGQIKRRFAELAGFLFRSQQFPHGAVLLTGTGIVPPDHFTLNEGDMVRIEVTGIGALQNTVTVV